MSEQDPGEESPDVDGELRERLADSDDEQVAREVAGLRERVAELEDALAEREDELSEREGRVKELEERLKRKQAEFQNYKKRTERRREEERQRATEELVERLLPVRDNLARALDTEAGSDIRDGVESTLRRFDDALDAEGVERIEPAPGEEVDPTSHEVLMRVDSEHPEGHIDEVHRPGYEMGGKVVRTAQVTVADEE